MKRNINIKKQLVSLTAMVLIYINNNEGCNLQKIRDNIINIHTGNRPTMAFICDILLNLEEMKLVKKKLGSGVTKILSLTKKGEKLAQHCEEIQKILQ